MSGAYVAKPAVPPEEVPVVPTPPPGWNPDWPFPGFPGYDPDPFFPAPFPPGYATSYSIVTTATESIAPTGTASATSSVRDQSTYATNEPSAITWTATIDGEAIGLKFDGEEDFVSSISEIAVWGTYWGTTPDIVFDLDDDNNGDMVILKASCTLVNSEGQVQVLESTSEIVIVTSAEFTAVVSYPGGGGFWYVQHSPTFSIFPFDADARAACIWKRASGFAPPLEVNTVNGVTEDYPYTLPARDGYIIVTVDGDGVTATINYGALSDGEYLSITPPLNTLFTTATVVLTLVINGTTYTKTLIDSGAVQHWLRIYNDGTVDVINP